jgi:hypothetical protein
MNMGMGGFAIASDTNPYRDERPDPKTVFGLCQPSGNMVLIRQLNEDCFIDSNHQWAPDESQAMEFATFEDAVQFAHQWNLKAAEIVLWFPDTGQHIPLPMPEETPPPAAALPVGGEQKKPNS